MLALPAEILAESLAPTIARWSESRERHILRSGIPLPPAALAFAEHLGIDDPNTLRIEITCSVPLPLPAFWVSLGQKAGLPVFHPAGMCLGRGISCLAPDLPLLKHELVHTRQYQRLGSHLDFMRRYLFECLHHGYHDSPLEIEACSRSHGQAHLDLPTFHARPDPHQGHGKEAARQDST